MVTCNYEIPRHSLTYAAGRDRYYNAYPFLVHASDPHLHVSAGVSLPGWVGGWLWLGRPTVISNAVAIEVGGCSYVAAYEITRGR